MSNIVCSVSTVSAHTHSFTPECSYWYMLKWSRVPYFSPDISVTDKQEWHQSHICRYFDGLIHLCCNTIKLCLTLILLSPFLSETKVKEPNFTLKRTFRVENTGLLPITIKSAEINGLPCEGYGFKVLSCQEFALKPNSSKDLIIL